MHLHLSSQRDAAIITLLPAVLWVRERVVIKKNSVIRERLQWIGYVIEFKE
jgi:hypothetical protein